MSHRLVDNEPSSTCLATSTFHLRAPGPVFCLFTIQGRCDRMWPDVTKGLLVCLSRLCHPQHMAHSVWLKSPPARLPDLSLETSLRFGIGREWGSREGKEEESEETKPACQELLNLGPPTAAQDSLDISHRPCQISGESLAYIMGWV